jgi:hypothetical protein
MALSNTASAVTMGVMKDAENLQEDLVSRLFGSLGIGTGIDTLA